MRGLRTIERVVIEGVRKLGRYLTAADFTWNRGRIDPEQLWPPSPFVESDDEAK